MTGRTDAMDAPHDRRLATELIGAIERHSRHGRVAFLTDDGETTYADLHSAILSRANAATTSGIGQGELVGLLGTRSVENVATFLGLLVAGACPCFIDPRTDDAQLRAQLSAVGMHRVIVHDDVRRADLRSAGSLAVHSYDDLRGEPNPVDHSAGEADRAMMLFTSGSTGEPKGVLLSQRNLLVNAHGVIERTELTELDRLLHLMPFHHTNGVNNQIIAPLLVGATVALAPRFSPGDAVRRLRSSQPTIVTGVPTMFLRMLEHVEDGERFDTLRFLRCGSAPITTTQQERIRRAFRVPVILSYGMSEATCTSTMNPVDAPRDGSVGTPLSGQEVRVVVPGTDQPVPVDHDGEVMIGGPAVMLGYLGSNAQTPVENGWIRTGDLGRFDVDGYLTITGRIKDTIIRGGENIAPATVERQLMLHPAVTDCCVVGRPHPDLGEVPVAFVSIAAGTEEPDEDELRSTVQAALGRSQTPQRVVVLTSLPTTSVGKLDRRRLSDEAAQLAG